MFGRFVATALAVALSTQVALAQGKYPERDITMIVPWAAGGGTDTVARTLVKNAKQHIGVGINVVNRPGGTGVVGMQAAASAKPDGYTIGLITFHLSSYRHLGVSQLSYRDFEPVALVNRSPAAFVVKADSKMNTLKDLVDYAKANPGVVTVANSGAGGPPHLAATMLAKQLGLKFTLVPFDGAAPARTALVGGHVTLLATGADEVLQFHKTKQTKFLAMINDVRHSAFPETPTVAEAGFPMQGLILDWRGVAAPKGTPPEILASLRDGFRKMAQDADVVKLMDELALPRASLEGEAFGKFLAEIEASLEPALTEAGLIKK